MSLGAISKFIDYFARNIASQIIRIVVPNINIWHFSTSEYQCKEQFNGCSLGQIGIACSLQEILVGMGKRSKISHSTRFMNKL